MSARILYLTGPTWRGRAMAPGELPDAEHRDHALIVQAGEAAGLSFAVRFWDESDLAQDGYDAALIRSCWDYTGRAREFISTLEAHERAGLRVFNPPSAVRWNARKTYLDALGDLSIPTLWSETLNAGDVARAFDAFDAAEIVVKPQIGAGSRATIRLKRNSWSDADLREGPFGAAAMLQPFLSSIESEGERSLFWFGGVYSHAIRKIPEAGGWYANRDGSTRFMAEAAPKDAREASEAALARAPNDLLYVRVDVVRDDAGGWRVIEIEAIEPYLFLAYAPEGAGHLVAALTRVLSL